MTEAYKKGQQAYFDGDNINHNPYDKSTDDHFEWDLGFNSASYHSK